MLRIDEYCLMTSGSIAVRTITVRTTIDHP